MQSDGLTWPEAAELVGCPVSTIDWYKRTGRIRSRGRRAGSLERQSVEEFASWWRARQVERERNERKRHPRRPRPPDGGGPWLAASQAAGRLGVTPDHVRYAVHAGIVPGTRHDGRIWLLVADVDAVVEERHRWVTWEEAARLVGCSRSVIGSAVDEERIESRARHGSRPTLRRDSVEEFARTWAAEQRTRDREAAARVGSERVGPPADGHVWLDTITAALVLGVSPNRVRQWAVEGRIPYSVRSRRRWFRRDHVEQKAAARARAAARSPAPGYGS